MGAGGSREAQTPSPATSATKSAVTYPDEFKAQEVRLTLWRLQREYLLELDDAVVVTKSSEGRIKLHQAMNLTAIGAVSGGFWGTSG